ncbi:MAG: hypothetical protein AB7Y46_14145 [Armatimonadota bacterium]
MRSAAMVRRRAKRALALAVALCTFGLEGTSADLVSVKVTAQRVEFSYDRRYVTLSGNARLFAQVVNNPSRYVSMQAGLIEGDLEAGRFELCGDVKIATPDSALAGDAARYDTATGQYWLRRGGVMLPIENPEGERVWGYAYAGEIETIDDVVYVIDGRFTTCDQPEPHYALEVDRIRYRPDTMQLTAWSGALRLYGVRIPLVPRVTVGLAEQQQRCSPIYWFSPGYSGRDGLRMQADRSLRSLDLPVEGTLSLKLTQRRGLRGELEMRHAWGNFAGRLNVTYEEDVQSDLEHFATINRLPELGVVGSWEGGGRGLDRVELGLWAGRYTQQAHPEAGPGEDITRQRLLLEARYVGNEPGRAKRAGAWWWVGGSQAFYDDGASYRWLEGGMGAALEPADWFSAWAEVSHRLPGGKTPFTFDDIDIQTELAALARVRLSPIWRLDLGGRYDFDLETLRDYSVELRRRSHCLTWTAEYNDVGESIRLGVEINGLFGNFEPPEQRSPEQGVPRYWDHVEGLDLLLDPAPRDPCPPGQTETMDGSGVNTER